MHPKATVVVMSACAAGASVAGNFACHVQPPNGGVEPLAYFRLSTATALAPVHKQSRLWRRRRWSWSIVAMGQMCGWQDAGHNGNRSR